MDLCLAIHLPPLWGYIILISSWLYTCRATGALKGWCAVRTLQCAMVGLS